MNANQLTINSSIDDFPEDQIKSAMSGIKWDSPLEHVLGLINAMSGYILSNEEIGCEIKDTYRIMDSNLNFYLRLIKFVNENN
ncbi:MAG: hypothetical protein FWF54_00290 [Candidatus Azobacteroides sp.]|nr:hypothetical protein [Candidatus Azobacteroides sp.]